MRRLALALAVLLAFGIPAGAATLKGVTVPDRLQVDGHDLVLQGLGLRKKTLFSVYVGALYLTTPTSLPRAAVGADEPKRLELRYLREVGAGSLREALKDGFFNNAQERLDALRPRLDRLLGFVAPGIKEGQALAFTYLPGRGTRVELAGQAKGVIEGKDFMEALWAVWLGEVPEDHGLRQGLLGQ